MGFNVDEMYASQSNRLKAADLGKQEIRVQIAGIGLVEFDEKDGRKKRMLELSFLNIEKTLPLNKTNAEAIAYAYGGDTDAWVGKVIILYPTMVSFGDNMVEAIRIRPELPQATGLQPPPQIQQPTQGPQHVSQSLPQAGQRVEFGIPFEPVQPATTTTMGQQPDDNDVPW